ncbi:MAG TPA: phage tail sheath subtilisin-like domain-containing protein, partial [Anaerolineae bacterium]|nr:phage tail sheath subtilisin-like domain-containing protein [Anaerolineae bacterium]
MPEYLAPGVYIEEVSFRPKSIEGVSTSTAGFVGPTRYGPTTGEPELLTSFADYERIYGGIDQLHFDSEGGVETENYMAHAVRAFFDNGGSRLYVSRVYLPLSDMEPFSGHASWPIGSPQDVTLRARFPGRAGDMRVVFAVRPSGNLLVGVAPNHVVRGVRENDVVYIHTIGGAGAIEGFYDVMGAGPAMTFERPDATSVALSSLQPGQHTVHLISLTVRVRQPGRFSDEQVWADLAPHPSHRNAVQTLFTQTPNTRNRFLTIPFAIDSNLSSGAEFLRTVLSTQAQGALQQAVMSDAEFAALTSPPNSLERPRPADLETVYNLTSGSDGNLPTQQSYRGQEALRDPSTGAFIESSGLRAFEDVEDISMVAAPGYSAGYASLNGGNEARWGGIVQELMIHCEIRMRYRVALLDSPNDFVLSEIRNFRGRFDSTHAALYYPWVTVVDPLDPDGRREMHLPPSGFVAGICARSDVRHGVFKAPANEVVLGAIGFEKLLNKAQQDVLN